MDALKDRVGAFTEGILLMSSPVILAVALKKVDLNSEGNPAVRGGISPLAACSLCISLIAFLLLGTTSLLRRFLQQRFGYFIEIVFRFSKLLVHGCAILQMVLAYIILLLITMKLIPFLVLLVVLGVFLAYCCYLSVWRSPEQSERRHPDSEKKLEPSLEFSATVTSLLFLALEGLALEGQTGIGQDLDHRLVPAISLTFVVCLVATSVMLLVTVPPCTYYDGNGTNNQTIPEEKFKLMCTGLHGLCFVLTVFLTAVVLTITFELEKEKGVTAIAVPCLSIFLWYLVCLCNPQGNEVETKEVKPASLELTKVTFTGFLAVSLPSIRDSSLSGNTHAFVLITSMAVLSGLLWRFLTHFKQRAAVWTAKVACMCTHGCVAAAAIPFMFMAIHALSDAEDECHVPCSSSPSTQLHTFVTCFVGKARETSSYTLSSVNC